MRAYPKIMFQLVALLGAAMAGYLVDVSDAHAQSASCRRLEDTLATLDRNRDFRNVDAAGRDARQVGRQVQRLESQ